MIASNEKNLAAAGIKGFVSQQSPQNISFLM